MDYEEIYQSLPPLIGALSLVLLLAAGCERAELHLPELADYYRESLTLPQQRVDSVDRFELKVADFASRRPEARNDSYYPLIIANIQQARIEIAVLNSPPKG